MSSSGKLGCGTLVLVGIVFVAGIGYVKEYSGVIFGASAPASVAPPAAAAAAPADIRLQAQAVFGDQYGCAANIITRESGWNVHAQNPTSPAYGIPQALPGDKMASAGPDWRDNPATQLAWMKGYVDGRYGGACGAWAFWQANQWY